MILQILRILLVPAIPMYAIIVFLRNKLFDWKLLKTEKVATKVISVGNITVGGSGKTPFVIYLAGLLKKNGLIPGVLSRGYGRNSIGFKLVSDGINLQADVDEVGDEIYHTAESCKVPAAVSEKRVEGARKLLEKTKLDFLILDDAFQHRYIYRDLDIVLIDQDILINRSFTNKMLLPSGNLREPFSNIGRADCIVINQKFSEKTDFSFSGDKDLKSKLHFYAYYNAVSFIDVRTKKEYSIKDFLGQKSLVISGIANPQSFLKILEDLHIDTSNKLLFVDHKSYTTEDIQQIRKIFYTANANSVIITEKDAVKLEKFTKDLDDIDIFFLKIELKIENEKEFINFMNRKLKIN